MLLAAFVLLGGLVAYDAFDRYRWQTARETADRAKAAETREVCERNLKAGRDPGTGCNPIRAELCAAGAIGALLCRP